MSTCHQCEAAVEAADTFCPNRGVRLDHTDDRSLQRHPADSTPAARSRGHHSGDRTAPPGRAGGVLPTPDSLKLACALPGSPRRPVWPGGRRRHQGTAGPRLDGVTELRCVGWLPGRTARPRAF